MMRRLFLQATLVCMLIALLATPAFAGLTTDPLGATGSQPPVNAQGTAPAPSITGDSGADTVRQGNTQAAPAHIYGEGGADSFHAAPVTAPAQIFPGAPEIGDINGDGYWDSDTDAYRDADDDSYGYRDADSDTWGSGADALQGGPALAVASPIVPGPQIVHLDGGCDDDQICGGMDDDQLDGGADDDQLDGGADKAVHP